MDHDAGRDGEKEDDGAPSPDNRTHGLGYGLASAPLPPLSPEDYYYDGPFVVFTAAYHLKRGYCCGSGCRHCPYGNAERSWPAGE